jgi:chloride channel 2
MECVFGVHYFEAKCPVLTAHTHSIRLAFEAIFRKSATLQDVDPDPDPEVGVGGSMNVNVAMGDMTDAPPVPPSPRAYKKVQLVCLVCSVYS